MNTYLIVTTDKVTLDEKIKELNTNNECEVVFYDLLEVGVEKLIEDLDTINFLASKKIVIGLNAFFLSSNKSKSTVEHNTDILEHYLDNQSNNILILSTDNIDKRKKLTTNILKKVNLIEEDINIDTLIKKRLEDYKISNILIEKLKNRCGNDSERILNEIDKLKLYKIDTKEINEEDIDNVVMENLDDNIFHFIDNILSGNKEYAFKQYNNFLLHGEQLVHMIILISNKIRLIYQVKELSSDGYSTLDISKKLKVHEYPVKLALKASYSYTDKKLLDLLNKLSIIDLNIKSGVSLGDVEFETLLASI